MESGTPGTKRLERIAVSGLVQGVGFRPFVHRLANRHRLGGFACNTPEGVLMELEGAPANLDSFIDDLLSETPPLAQICALERLFLYESGEQHYQGFEIRKSIGRGRRLTLIPPDICVCDDCLDELFQPENRRFLYPFINCTNCGPRFTIIRSMPYDRPATTMANFTMCPECRSEYVDPSDRRFHAQPNACPRCGPRLTLVDRDNRLIPGDPVFQAVALLKQGKILAVKGLGGFHLAVDSADDRAVQRLRLRKHREEKPFALMTGSLYSVRQLVRLTASEERLLTSRERPIILAEKYPGAPAVEAVAPGNERLGVMLPYTPLHYLLFFHPEAGGNYSRGDSIFPALVMTSANLCDEPICKDNNEARERLRDIADAFLMHDREINVRCDDSVVHCMGGEPMFIRRSRGYAPVPIIVQGNSPPILALGGELKNTLCLLDGRRAFMSQHIGDLERSHTLAFFHDAVNHFTKALDIAPQVYACDLHPDYFSTKYLERLRGSRAPADIISVGVQHHHAHIASVLAEHGFDGPVIGLAMDGAGYGPDGTVWGGEILICTPDVFVRAGHIDCVPLPGGSAAVRQPWRMAFSHLHAAYGDRWDRLDLPCLTRVPRSDLEVLLQACSAGLNSPLTSSLGRLFDAAASILDLCHETTYEGQAALLIETAGAANNYRVDPLPHCIRHDDREHVSFNPVVYGPANSINATPLPPIHGGYILDYRPAFRAMVEGVIRKKPTQELALAFHTTLAASFADIADRLRESTGIDTIACSGGCWQNRLLSGLAREFLEQRGFKVISNRLAPVNDGGLSLGQAYAAAAVVGSTGERKIECALQFP
ncbi:MAG: carbamoyltransferase HypF [Candidatus Latescibacter sp.]|nr:carbamoyltransferase HypF [Candidatus Latescibacter sp.]